MREQQIRILPADGELRVRIAETALARPYHGHDGHFGLAPGDQKRSERRCEPAVKEIAVELSPIRSRLPRFDHIAGAPAADLDPDLFLPKHRDTSLYRFI